MKYLITGRTGTDKNALAKSLAAQGFSVLKTYTTRPKSDDNDNSHIFISQEEADNYPDKFIPVVINGYEYFSTKEDVEKADVCVVDIQNIKDLTETFPDTSFHIAYVETPYDELRKEMAVKRAEDPLKEAAAFDKKNAAENERFTEFEKILNDPESLIAENCRAIHRIENDYSEGKMYEWAVYLTGHKAKFDRMLKIIDTCLETDILKPGSRPGTVNVAYRKKDSSGIHTKDVSVELFTDDIFACDEGIASIMRAYLSLPVNLQLE